MSVAAQSRMPHEKTLTAAWKLSCQGDLPIWTSYWEDAVNGRVVFGVRNAGKPNEERLLVRSQDEYTSTVQNVYMGAEGEHGDYIVVTENSIYIVPNNIQSRHIGN